jgi:excisionase family DNA binding protein
MRTLYGQICGLWVLPSMNPNTPSNNSSVRVLRVREAARYLGISPWKIRRLVSQGLPYIQDGEGNSAWRFDIHDLEEWIERNKVRLA